MADQLRHIESLDEVLCAACGRATSPVEPCASCGDSPFVRGYALARRIGHGAVGTTYEALRLRDGKRVAIKEILVRRFESAKGMQLFDREAEVLRRLDHPGIPKYYDHFTHGDGKSLGFYLVQEFIDGWTLEEEAQRKSHGDEDIFLIANELAEILAYTEDRLVHRDIKPSNVMRRESDGRLMLIDFGSVRQVAHSITDGSTITGTVGFMAPEQLMGRASFATDVYGVGMTLLRLRLGELPPDLRDDDGELRKSLRLGNCRPMLERLVAENPDRRPSTYKQLQKALDERLTPAKQRDDQSLARLHEKRRNHRGALKVFKAISRTLTWVIVIAVLAVGLASMFFPTGTTALGALGLIVVLGLLGSVVVNHPE